MGFVRFANKSGNMKLFLSQKSKQNNFRFAHILKNIANNPTNCRFTLKNKDLSHIHLAVKPSAEEVNDMSKSCMFGSGNIGSLCII